MRRFAKQAGIPLDVPWVDLELNSRASIIDGDGERYGGIRGFFDHLERKKYKLHVRVFLEPLPRLLNLHAHAAGRVCDRKHAR